ncbi:YbaN family protein [Campylobacterota bacterium]
MQTRFKKILFMSLGFFFILLAVLGVLLPLLPTTPFIILSAFLFSKSSDRWHQWLLSNKVFGPILNKWECYRCIPRFAKLLSFSMIALFGSFSVVSIPFLWLKVVTILLIAYGYYFIANIQTCAKEVSAVSVDD